ncbi:MAG TPA: 1,4-dihydroxy-2-naphthoate octaprenyltransferase [Algoriphagus sp.]|uniref:1,4-dihydroxy-2-naphthoate polyprenyltransferase n=1 Tax=unclassified Algoriphagus TaxID=2641541 RepID=UPI000C66DDF1|nr:MULTISPECIES: 1,4-dihydroxy-2-naphthoate polyprenyltransferase [unclassified Algoriphagus]MAL11872.1 1,4-dihydroxy-2-naphthoate octaprenyltransferase [Algoriphagus sp.]MAN86541.1 1,4-dihydroxy-2-naphthoate octaprenyltransferase [Algoriphagus sp.]QYH38707.1 1,4-dihydroxy-2-naphthoate polyprenyltransferase [Algoriphagus sp. NBT04N3]HAD50108.1 1,4-dihydroxy-2-naphthoate octaprenyltransferase [Algoriphagus sp.]HAS60607.1 1,4-dihydroxy-2-naphthoate octaprenyltransferase [Algoriphagus sp.]
MKREINTKKEAWLHAVRLRTLPLALASIFAGSFIAAWQNSFRWEILVLASLTTVFLQILSNLSNDYGDSVHGADSIDRQGPVRAVQSGLITLPEMKKAMYLFGALSLISGLSLLYLAVQDLQIFLLFLGLGLAAIWASITYTSGKNPYGYAGLGDLSVFIFFGLLGVLGTYFLHTYSSNNLAVLIAVALGFFSTAVLNINNIRDIDSDKLAGKKSIPVRIGRSNAVKYNWSLIILGNLALLWFVIYSSEWFSLIALLASILMIKVARGVQVAQSAQETDPYLKKMAISTLFWVVLFGIGLLF